MRRRITTIATSIVSVVLVAIAIVVVVTVRRQLTENLDRSLDQRAAEVEASVVAGEIVLVTSDREDHFTQVLATDGRIVLATENAVSVSLADRLPSTGTTAFTSSEIPIEDDVYRVLIRATELDGEPAFVVVGENIDDLRDTTRALVVTLVVVIPLAVAALAAVVWWLVGRTLRPVEAIRREVDEIGLGDLGRRVPAPHTDDEVDRLASTMNEMLARLEASAARQRRFVADASHELRTPLTRLRAGLEVAAAGGNHRAEPSDVVTSALEDAVEMEALVDDLLFLARRDAGSVPPTPSLVDLDVVVLDEIRSMRRDGPLAFDVTAVSAAPVRGDERTLRRLVRNLLSNAMRHAESTVAVSLVDDGSVELVVDDDGPGIPVAERDRVFERFVRLDGARAHADGGTGLGLAIVREISSELGGSVRVGESRLGGAAMVVELPSARHQEL